MPIPLVAIVGRPNVGKSTLFNALLRRRISIVDDTAGTTRDRVAAVLRTEGWTIELVDTGGLGIVDESRLAAHIEAQIDIALRDADVIVFVVDVRDGVTALDQRMAARLRRMDRPVVLVANKADVRNLEFEAHAFHSLGLGEPVPTSAQERINTREVLERIFAALPKPETPVGDGTLRIAILGKRNAGKSTLLNALAGTPRVIVSEIPGTTRDAVDVKIRHGDKEYTFIDTAGVVKRTLVDDAVEYYAQVRINASP
jgi:GTP-binding protein